VVTIVNTGQKDRKTNMEIKKPYAVFQYNKFMKAWTGRTTASVLFSYVENCKVVKKVVLYLLNCTPFNACLVYSTRTSCTR
jgi:hypothetical protein